MEDYRADLKFLKGIFPLNKKIMKNDTSNSLPPSAFTRRQFLATAGASALSLAVAQPRLVRGAESDAKINIGLIGCGGRGTGLPTFS